MKHLKSNWMSNLKTQNEALVDLILGILIFGILVVFVGLFSMKPAAILSPQIHKYVYTRIFGKGR